MAVGDDDAPFADTPGAQQVGPYRVLRHLGVGGMGTLSLATRIDGDGTVGHAYAAKTTPHCYVIDSKGVLVYAGAIDDQAGKNPKNYVVNAIQALKDGKDVSPATTPPYGCPVKYGKGK